jgi:hypothetical protein
MNADKTSSHIGQMLSYLNTPPTEPRVSKNFQLENARLSESGY